MNRLLVKSCIVSGAVLAMMASQAAYGQ